MFVYESAVPLHSAAPAPTKPPCCPGVMALMPDSMPAAEAGCKSNRESAVPLQSKACRLTAGPQHAYPACWPAAIALARDVGPRSIAMYFVCALTQKLSEHVIRAAVDAARKFKLMGLI